MFLSDADIKASLAAHLKQAVADLDDAVWGPLIGRAHAAAYQEVLGRLLKRGFTVAQITAADSGPFWEESITLYYLAARGSFGEAYDLAAAKLLDKRGDLDTCQVFVRGVWIKPGEGAPGPGTINHGPGRTAGTGSTFGDEPGSIRWAREP